MRIDSHHHFWKYIPDEYGWIDASMTAIRRDFLPPDLKLQLDKVGIDGAVSVQARQTLEETNWLLDLADKHDFLRGVVGWVPLADANAGRILDALANRSKLKGIRHVVQDELDDDFILRDDFNAGVRLLADYGLVYDILIYERHLPQAIEFVDRHPKQMFVVDHLAKPRVKDQVAEPWRAEYSPACATRECVLQVFRLGNRSQLEELDRSAALCLFGNGARCLWPATRHVRQRLASVPRRQQLRKMA